MVPFLGEYPLGFTKTPPQTSPTSTPAPWLEEVWALAQERVPECCPGRCLTKIPRRTPQWGMCSTGSLGCSFEGLHTRRVGGSWMLPEKATSHLRWGIIAETTDVRSIKSTTFPGALGCLLLSCAFPQKSNDICWLFPFGFWRPRWIVSAFPIILPIPPCIFCSRFSEQQ